MCERRFWAGLSTALIIGCNVSGSGPAPLAFTVDTGGPRIIFDLEARPLPEIPLPNDLATKLDPTAATGRRLNVSERAPTGLESRMRQKFNRLDGFGTYSPVTVAFSQPLEISPGSPSKIGSSRSSARSRSSTKMGSSTSTTRSMIERRRCTSGASSIRR